MKKKFILGIVILIVVTILSYLLYLVIEDNSKQNTLVEFDTVEEYSDELINVSEDDTDYMDDLIFSIYTLGYRDDFMKLYNDNVKSCLYDNEYCEVEELYEYEEVNTSYINIKPVYVVLLRQLDGEVEYIDCITCEPSYYIFDIADSDIIITNSDSFDSVDLVENTTEVAKNVKDSSIYEEGYCKDTENIILDESSNLFGIINVTSEGDVDCDYDMLNTIRIQNIYDILSNMYIYEYGDEKGNTASEEFLSPYFDHLLTIGSTLNIEIDQIFYKLGDDKLQIESNLDEYITNTTNDNGTLNTLYIIEHYSEYQSIYYKINNIIENYME